jgi:protein-tyrosine phosphatase
LEGATNFRDLGGYPTAGGGQTRWGLVFRSDAPHRLTPADRARIGQLGLRAVYDLRTDKERELAPSMLLDPKAELLAIGGSAGNIHLGRIENVPDDFLVTVYGAMADNDARTFGRLLTALAAPGGLPALFHCTAGKDRTGMGAALLLSALGVDEAAVLDDYTLSAGYFTARRLAKLAGRGIDTERFQALFGAPRHAMAAALADLRERYGSVEGYLAEQAGVTTAVLATLRAELVQDS